MWHLLEGGVYLRLAFNHINTVIKASHLCEHAQCGHVDDGFGLSEMAPLKQ